MPSMEVELTRDSVLKQVGLCFSEMDARAFVDALKSYVRSGKLPPLPTKSKANG